MSNLPIWNLADFYPSFNSKLIKDDLNKINKQSISFSNKYKSKLKNRNIECTFDREIYCTRTVARWNRIETYVIIHMGFMGVRRSVQKLRRYVFLEFVLV